MRFVPDPPELDNIALDRVDQQIRGLVDMPLARVLVLSNPADAGILQQGFGRVPNALGDPAGGFRIFLCNVVVACSKSARASRVQRSFKP